MASRSGWIAERWKMRINATYKVVTPMFCGGAEPKNHSELRLASFKGALRFWWRALAWSRLDGQLEDIRHQEDIMFGSAKGGQSRVLMKLDPRYRAPKILKANSVLRASSRSNSKIVGNGARYLGYGVIKAQGQLERACLQAPFPFTVQIRCHSLDEVQRKSLENALIALGTLGGMGAKSRKGYGSLVLQSLCVDGEEQWTHPSGIDDLINETPKCCGNLNRRAWPKYTALSNMSRHVFLPSDLQEPLELLDLVGKELVDNRNSEHDRSDRLWRIAFGLPRKCGMEKVEPCDDSHDKHRKKLDRRASPLFIHIHECGTSPVAVLSFLPARFLPEGRNKISVGGHKVDQKHEDELYIPVCNFLDRLLDSNQHKESFINPVGLKP